MRFVSTCILALVTGSIAVKIPDDHILWGAGGRPETLVRRATSISTVASSSSTKVADPACTNGPLTRNCWSNGYSVATDFDAKWPTTGRTVTYNLEITNTTCNPDGHGPRRCLLFNNQYPGPTLQANWGDTMVINVKNSMSANGTGIHWHGIRQLNSNVQDGVGGITECPIAPGDSKTYTFKCTQFGTTWYHSHYSSQYGDGAHGAIVINGPATSNYDVDLGSYTISDFYYQTAWQIDAEAEVNLQIAAAPPSGDNILLNGTNKNAAGGGSYGKVSMTKGKKYRLRLINTGVDNMIRVSLDNHPFTVITSDLVPIKPYTTNWILIGVGQRYDVIINANATVGNYWFRANAASDCRSANNFKGLSIFSYSGADSNDPTSSGSTAPSVCQDESPLVPWVPNTVGDASAFESQVGDLEVDIDKEQVATNGQNIVVWGVNLTGIDVNWDMPTLEYVKTGNSSYPHVANLIELPTEGIWAYWIIQETSNTVAPIPHPIHLHGHDFYVLGTGSGVFDKSTSPNGLTYNNPTRRDTAILPGGGWLAIAFPTDNPGAWLMHCHIAWHISEGLGVQFLESKGSINLPDAAWEQTCANYQKYDQSPPWPKVGSGL